jgi:hypothetical protein
MANIKILDPIYIMGNISSVNQIDNTNGSIVDSDPIHCEAQQTNCDAQQTNCDAQQTNCDAQQTNCNPQQIPMIKPEIIQAKYLPELFQHTNELDELDGLTAYQMKYQIENNQLKNKLLHELLKVETAMRKDLEKNIAKLKEEKSLLELENKTLFNKNNILSEEIEQYRQLSLITLKTFDRLIDRDIFDEIENNDNVDQSYDKMTTHNYIKC